MEERPLAHLLIETCQEAACLMDAQGRVIALNKGGEEITGFRESELIARSFPGKPKMVTGAGADSALAWLLAPARQWIDMRIKRKDEREIDASCEVFRLGAKNLVGILIKFRPEGAWSADGAALEDMKIKLEAIFGGMADGLVLINEFGSILLFSAGAEKLFGYRAEEVLGQNVKMLMPSPYHEEHDRYLAAYRETGARKIIGIGREVSGRRKNGAIFPMYLSVGEIWLEGRRYFVGVTHDLTSAKSVESRLWMLSAAVEQSPVAIMISDKHGVIEYVNSCFTKLSGYAEDELLGKNPRVLQSGETPKERHQRLWQTISSGGEWRGEIQDRRKNGEPYWAYETISPLYDPHGELRHYLAIQQDITEQRRDREALTESEERFRKVAEMVGEWLWEQDAEGRYTYSSDAVKDILGLEPADVLGKRYLDLFQDGASESGYQPVWTRAAPFRRVTNCYRRPDGRRVFTESSGAPLFDENGRLIKWRGVDRDITERVQYEAALRVRNRAIESVDVGIVISDARAPRHPNIYVNPALARMTGYTQDELMRGGMHMLQGPGTDPAAIEEIRRGLQTGQSFEVTLKNYRKNGEAFWNELFISPVRDESGQITHYIGVQTDVTEKRRAEENRQELEIAKQIQLSLLPSKPLRLAHAEVAGVCLPATHVGGDYFDYFENDGNIDFLIADVSGHSVGAALIMTEVRSMVRARLGGTSTVHPAVVLRELNVLLEEDLDRSELFITMFCCRYAQSARRLTYANAGHNPGLLLRRGDVSCVQLDADGLVLGVEHSVEFEERDVLLSAGDKLLFYTDGVTEAQDLAGTFYGLERLCVRFADNRMLPPEAIAKSIINDVREFCAPAAAEDDMALLVLEVR